MPQLSLRFAYFGGEPLGVPVLEKLHAAGYVPSLVVCNPDRPAGRKLQLTPPPVKVWAEAQDIPVFQPETLKNKDALTPLTNGVFDLFIVVAYNKIIPTWLIELPTHKTINVHPSLLPQYRGASPIRTAILENNPAAIGVSIMLMDSEMDHGPILAQSAYSISREDWPADGRALDAKLAELGGSLLVETLPQWLAGAITPTEQDHARATYCSKIAREDSELIIDPHHLPAGETAAQVLRKIRAYAGWPGTFFVHESARIKIVDASLGTDGALQIHEVTPAGKNTQPFSQYLASLQ